MELPVTLFFIYLGSMALPAISAWAFASKTPQPYRPISIFLRVLFVITAIRYLAKLEGTAELIFDLIDPYIILLSVVWIAKGWNAMVRSPKLYIIIPAVMLVFNIADRVWLSGPAFPISWFNFTVVLLISLIAIDLLAYSVSHGDAPPRKHPVFFFGLGLLLLSISAYAEMFMLMVYKTGAEQVLKMSSVYFVIGIISNLFFLKSFTCIPSKKGYSLS